LRKQPGSHEDGVFASTMAITSNNGRQRIGLIFIQMIVWFGLMGLIIFSAAGTTNCVGGWLTCRRSVGVLTKQVCGNGILAPAPTGQRISGRVET